MKECKFKPRACLQKELEERGTLVTLLQEKVAIEVKQRRAAEDRCVALEQKIIALEKKLKVYDAFVNLDRQASSHDTTTASGREHSSPENPQQLPDDSKDDFGADVTANADVRALSRLRAVDNKWTNSSKEYI